MTDSNTHIRPEHWKIPRKLTSFSKVLESIGYKVENRGDYRHINGPRGGEVGEEEPYRPFPATIIKIEYDVENTSQIIDALNLAEFLKENGIHFYEGEGRAKAKKGLEAMRDIVIKDIERLQNL